MSMIQNPILPGMAPDPSIIRVGEDYYIANSTFHWFPGVLLFHSRDLSHWEQLPSPIDSSSLNLRGTNTPAGIWAPHLSYDENTQTYWLAYSLMQNMAGREFNADTYITFAKDMRGPWSKPQYVSSIGFDPALFHDDDGRHYISVLEWETRVGYQAPGTIVIAEIDLETYEIGKWQRITNGFTTRGCCEAPQVYKRGEYYYLLLASGGTGYGHAIEIGRSKSIFGPYEPNPTGEPIITSNSHHLFSLGDPDAGHFEMFNPNSEMQKAGHGSLVSTPNGEYYIAHLMSRPLSDKMLLNPLGRESSLQKVVWTEDGWLAMADGSNLAKMQVEAPQGTVVQDESHAFAINEDFSSPSLAPCFMTPYHPSSSEWVDLSQEGVKIFGRGSLFSQVNPAILATRATSLKYSLQTKVTHQPVHFSESAGCGLYYDSNNWLYARLTLSQDEKRIVLRLLQAKLGSRKEYIYQEVDVPQGEISIRMDYDYGKVSIYYSTNETDWRLWFENLDVSYLSDEGVNGEPGEIGGFTGLFNFIGAVDAHQHKSFGQFFYYKVSQ